MSSEPTKEDSVEFTGTGLALGISVGVAIGAGVGVLMDNIAIWIPIGMVFGVALALVFSAVLGES